MSKALLKYIRLSPTKARLIAREIQGMNAELALATLEFAPNKAAKVIYKVLASAIANGNYDAQSVVVKSCRIDAGPVLRRMSPRARGRANMIRKPTAHILVEVADPKEIAKALEAQKVQKAQKAKKESKRESKKALAKVGKKDIVKVEKATKKVSESKKADSPKVSKDSSESAPKATKTTKATKDSSPKAESKVAKEAKEPKAKKPSATKTAKTTTSEDK